MWNSYDATAGTSRKPMSYFENTTNLSKALGYIDQTDFKVHINPNLWRNKDGYANGAMIGQITYDVTGKDHTKLQQVGHRFLRYLFGLILSSNKYMQKSRYVLYKYNKIN